MQRFLFSFLLSGLGFLSHAQDQTGSPLAVSRLEDFIEATKHVAEPGATRKVQVEIRPQLNRLLIIAAHDFEQITRYDPSRDAYMQALDRGLQRFDSLLVTPEERYEAAYFYIDLMDNVGVDGSDGRLDAFVVNWSATLTASSKLIVRK